MRSNDTGFLEDYRCSSCNKLLFKGLLIISTVQIKCRKCGALVMFNDLDSLIDEDVFSLLANDKGIVVNMGLYKKEFCGNQRSFIGKQLLALLRVMGYPNLYKEIQGTFISPDYEKTFERKIMLNDSPVTCRWNLLSMHRKSYVYLVMDRHPSISKQKQYVRGPDMLPSPFSSPLSSKQYK